MIRKSCRVTPNYGKSASETETSGSGGSTTPSDGGSGGAASGTGGAVVDPNAKQRIAIGDTIELAWKPPLESDDSITMEVLLKGTGWFAFGIGSGMSVRRFRPQDAMN